jgi:hypothetical protein
MKAICRNHLTKNCSKPAAADTAEHNHGRYASSQLNSNIPFIQSAIFSMNQLNEK